MHKLRRGGMSIDSEAEMHAGYYESMEKSEGISTKYAMRKLSLVGHYSEEFLLADFTILIQVKFINHSFPIVDG